MPFDADYQYTPRERLLLIADALDDVNPRQLRLGCWCAPSPECGTVACALGWGIIKHGEALNMTLDCDRQLRLVPFLDGTPAFDAPGTWERFSAHFGISVDTCLKLFGGGGLAYGTPNPTPKVVAAKIRWVADHKMLATC